MVDLVQQELIKIENNPEIKIAKFLPACTCCDYSILLFECLNCNNNVFDYTHSEDQYSERFRISCLYCSQQHKFVFQENHHLIYFKC